RGQVFRVHPVPPEGPTNPPLSAEERPLVRNADSRWSPRPGGYSSPFAPAGAPRPAVLTAGRRTEADARTCPHSPCTVCGVPRSETSRAEMPAKPTAGRKDECLARRDLTASPADLSVSPAPASESIVSLAIRIGELFTLQAAGRGTRHRYLLLFEIRLM